MTDFELISVLDYNNYETSLPKLTRTAVRGIICLNDRLALIYSNEFGEFKFPGGGMELGETLEETLIREVKEETGLVVIPGSIKPYGKVLEIKKDKHTPSIFEHTSYYYMCDVEDVLVERKLDWYEEKRDYTLTWEHVSNALNSNNEIKNIETMPWVLRDNIILSKLYDTKLKERGELL